MRKKRPATRRRKWSGRPPTWRKRRARSRTTSRTPARISPTRAFSPWGKPSTSAEQELEAESRETEQAFTELEGAVSGFQAEAETAWNEAEAELEEATTDLAEGESALQGESSEGVQAFGTAATELEGACAALEADVDTIYDVCDQGVEAQGQAWQQAVQTAGQEALTFVTEGQQLRLDHPAAMVKDEVLATLLREYETLGTLLEDALTAVGDLEPLAEDLVKCQAVMRRDRRAD